MFSFRNIFQFSFLAANGNLYGSQKIQWGGCDEFQFSTTPTIKCANLSVPLDYTEPTSNETLRLELVKIPAINQPSRGSILFNFGGPGLPTRGSLAATAPIFLGLSGGYYDLIAFDPRGTGNTLPFSCTDNDLEAAALSQEMQVMGNSSDVTLGRLWARGTINSNLCFNNANQTGSLIGTAFVARDLMSVVDALDEDGMLRYWGFSYGTTLGATVAAMFPDRIDKMILDGVQNPHDYYHAPADFEEWTDTDQVFSGIFSWCVAVPELCPLARGNVTATELEDAVWALIHTVKYHPIPLGGFLLDYNTLKAIIVINLYSTTGWPQLVTLLDLLLTGNLNGVSAELVSALVEKEDEKVMMAIVGIHCGERVPRSSSLEDFLPAIDQLYNTSRFMGDVTSSISMICAQWKIKAKERYQGDFKVQTKEPVLFIGNTYDGLTPLVSAYNVSSGFDGSVVLEVNGYGHSSLVIPSTCTFEIVSAYWSNGSLPEPGLVCEVDSPLYFNVTWGDIIKKSLGEDKSLQMGSYDIPSGSFPIRKWIM